MWESKQSEGVGEGREMLKENIIFKVINHMIEIYSLKIEEEEKFTSISFSFLSITVTYFYQFNGYLGKYTHTQQQTKGK